VPPLRLGCTDTPVGLSGSPAPLSSDVIIIGCRGVGVSVWKHVHSDMYYEVTI
jgi:hypothetical protein